MKPFRDVGVPDLDVLLGLVDLLHLPRLEHVLQRVSVFIFYLHFLAVAVLEHLADQRVLHLSLFLRLVRNHLRHLFAPISLLLLLREVIDLFQPSPVVARLVLHDQLQIIVVRQHLLLQEITFFLGFLRSS